MTITTELHDVSKNRHWSGMTTRHELVIRYNDTRLVNMSNWLFHSCAISELKSWNSYGSPKLTKEQVDELLTYLKKPEIPDYNPTEYMFLESTPQRNTEFLNELTSRSCVKLIDTWINKSHPPNNPVYLWRLSLKEDFK